MILIIALFASFATVTHANYSCTTIEEFGKANKNIKQPLINIFSLNLKEDDPFSKFLSEVATKMKNLSLDFFAITTSEGTIKITREELLSKDPDASKVNRYAAIRKICEIGNDAKSFKLSDCKQKFVLRFKGCVEKESFIYNFQEFFTDKHNLADRRILDKYFTLSGKQKIDFMLNVISSFQKIHDKQIVHGKISPFAIIVNDDKFDDARIVNFEYSGQPGTEISKDYLDWYFSPSGENKPKTLSFDQDVYALAVTFAMIEYSSYENFEGKLTEDCFQILESVTEKCIKSFKEGVIAAFNEVNQTNPLKKVMEKAISDKPEERFKSMTEFAEAIKKVRGNLPTKAEFKKTILIKFKGCDEQDFFIYLLGCRLGFPSQSHHRVLAEKEFIGSKAII